MLLEGTVFSLLRVLFGENTTSTHTILKAFTQNSHTCFKRDRALKKLKVVRGT